MSRSINAPTPQRVTKDVSAAILRGVLYSAVTAAFSGAAHAVVDPLTMSFEELLDIKVVGASKYEQSISEVPAAVSVITRDEIRMFGWRTLDQALASLPGIYTTYDRQYGQLGTRGFGLPGDFNTRVLVTINGNRINEPVYDGGAVDRVFPLDMDLIERIEFIPGPGGAVYGQNAMFGVVNVITRDGAGVDGMELTASYEDPLDTFEGRASWGKRYDNGLDVLVSGSGLWSDGDDNHFDFPGSGVSGVAKDLDGERDTEAFIRLAYGNWSFDFEYGDRRKDDPTGTYFSDPLQPGQYQADRYEVGQLQFNDDYLEDTLHLTGRLFVGREKYTSRLRYGSA